MKTRLRARPAHIKWLLDSDPAIRWQVMRDITGEAPNAIAAERSRVATEGWGAQLLTRQSPAGNWGAPAGGEAICRTVQSQTPTLIVLATKSAAYVFGPFRRIART